LIRLWFSVAEDSGDGRGLLRAAERMKVEAPGRALPLWRLPQLRESRRLPGAKRIANGDLVAAVLGLVGLDHLAVAVDDSSGSAGYLDAVLAADAAQDDTPDHDRAEDAEGAVNAAERHDREDADAAEAPAGNGQWHRHAADAGHAHAGEAELGGGRYRIGRYDE
jgi:hypothetical protein